MPDNDLESLERIYVIPERENQLYLGAYMPFLSYIELVWDISNFKSPLSKFIYLLNTEFTFYHEIGHHVYRHSFGQDEDKEDEADKYASNLMDKSHPVLKRIVKTLKRIGLNRYDEKD